MVPFNNLKDAFAPYTEELSDIARSVVDSGWFVLGPNVEEFEKNFASFIGASHCVGVANGTDALEIALRSVGVSAGDEVLTVANAGGYTTTALNSIGAVPVYFDIDESLLGDASKITELLSEKSKAVVVTHLYGQAVDVSRVRNVVGKEIAIVEDCAESHGASFDGIRTGALGDISAFSFYPTKNLGALGDGGAVLTSDPDLLDKVKLYRQYGWEKKYKSSTPYGRNSRLDEMQAAFLNFMLDHLETMNKQRVEICDQYRRAAPSMFDHLQNGERYVGHLAIGKTERRDEFRELCQSRGIATDIHFPILDCHQDSMRNVVFRKGDLAVSEKSVSEIVSLPCYPNMPQVDIDAIVQTLIAWTSK